MLTLTQLNQGAPTEFLTLLGPVFEHAPWVAEAVLAQRPFASVNALHAAMLAKLRALDEQALLELLRGHPELAGAQARAGTMTADSVAEQGELAHLDAATAARWDALNAAYRARFGFPFILCIRHHTQASALQTFEQRLQVSRADELGQALEEIAAISRLRLAARLSED